MKNNTDYVLLFGPLLIIVVAAVTIFMFPDVAVGIIGQWSDLFVNQLGFFYICMGLFVLGGSFYFAFSRFGKITLGNGGKPVYSNFRWGAMIFTSTMAADLLYWSLIEWGYYYNANPTGLPAYGPVEQQQWASSYPLFHWGPIPWAFYILPAVAYAYMFFVKGRGRQTLSEACRPLLGKKTDGFIGRAIDVFAIVGLLSGTATTFSLTTPLMSQGLSAIFGIKNTSLLTICILVFVGFVFTVAVLVGMKGISKLASICVFLFLSLLAFVFIFGPSKFIIESGISGVGRVVQNFIGMATWTDPLRATGSGDLGFPQQWTIFYWSYWIAWFVATPFFIAKISEGRTIRQMVLGAFSFGLAGTFLSFTVFGNFGLYQQVTGVVDATGMLEAGTPPAMVILQLLETLPYHGFAVILLFIAMVAFYASTFDAITLVVSGFCTKKLEKEQDPRKSLRAFWCLVFLILPVALISSNSTLEMLQTLSIAAALPLSIIMILIITGFYKDIKSGYSDRI